MCNDCSNWRKVYDDEMSEAYTVNCAAAFYKTATAIRPRVIRFRVYDGLAVTPPSWCPLRPENKDKPKVVSLFDLGKSNSTSELCKGGILGPSAVKKEAEKKDTSKEEARTAIAINPITNWDDIKEGEEYIVPRLKYSKCKLFLVVSKSEYMIRCKEIEDGKVSMITSVIYKSSEESKFIVKKHNF